MNIAIVGCGFVADYYLATLSMHPELSISGVVDRQTERAETLSVNYGLRQYNSVTEVFEDPCVELVLNLTNPRDHYTISKAALEAGKHVYSEKPLAMEMAEATELIELAEQRGLQIVSAPCTLLSETAQMLWKVLRENVIGKVRVVYAEMDDGMVHLMQYRRWQSISGLPWPYKDEFEIGCTLEHAGYYLTWLAAWFGPATAVTAFTSVQVENKVPGEALIPSSPDCSVACIQFASGIVARLTCSILAPHDHSLKIVGDKGILYTRDCWHSRSPVYSRRMISIRRKTFLSPLRKVYPLPSPPYGNPKILGAQSIDFASGPAELARAIRDGRLCRISPRFSLHVNELALAIHHAARQGATYRMTTTFQPLEPMPWAL